MAFAGLKKQLNKANQFVSEKMGTAEGTKLTDEYLEMEKKTDVTIELVDEMINKTKEYLQPNPATRAKMQLSNRVGQQGGGRVYGQPEGVLGDTMVRTGKRLGETNLFAQSLNEMGEAFRQMSEIKFSLEDNVKQNFLDPLTALQNKEIKDVNFHRKKLESRRLDYDCKKRRKPSSQAEQVELTLAQAKFEQSLNLAAQGMHNLLQNQTEHINQLTALTQALHEYHSQCAMILEGLTSRLNEKKNEAASQPQENYVHKKLDELKGTNNTQSENSENNGQQAANNDNASKQNVNPFSGAIIDRLGYERPLCFGLTVLFVSTALFAVGRSYEVLFFARSLQGVGSAFADTSGFAMIADRFTEPDQREKALGIALSFVSFGCLAAPPFGGFLYEFFGKQLPFIVLSLICLLDGFLVILIMSPNKKQGFRSRRSSTNFGVTNATSKINYPHSNQYESNHRHSLMTTTADETPQGTPIYVLLKDRFIIVCAGALVMANISLASLEPTISIWMQDTMEDIENWQLGMIWLPTFFPYVYGVYFTVNYNRKYPSAQYMVAIFGLALTGVSCLVIPLATNYYQLFLPIAILCFGVAVIDTAVFPLLAFIVDTRYVSVYGSVYAIADISYSIAYAGGPILAGNIMGTFGFQFLNIFIAILVAAYCPVLMSLKKINEYNVINNHNIESSSKPSSLDENSIEDNQIGLCVDPNFIGKYRSNHHSEYGTSGVVGVKMIDTSIFNQTETGESSYTYQTQSKQINQQSTTELTRTNYQRNYE